MSLSYHSDCTFSKSILPSSLPLLPPSNEQQQSHTRSSPITTTTNQTRVCREENTFIRSEIDNKENNKENKQIHQ